MNQRVRAVIRREYLQRVKNKWFIVTTILIPALFLGLWGVVIWLADRPPTSSEPLQVGVVDRSGAALDDRLEGLFTSEYGTTGPGESAADTAEGAGTTPGTGAGSDTGAAAEPGAEDPGAAAEPGERVDPGAAARPGADGPDASPPTLPGLQGTGLGARAPVQMRPADVAVDASREELARALEDSEFDAYLVLPQGVLEPPAPDDSLARRGDRGPRILSSESVSDAHRRVIRSATRRAVVATRLERAGASGEEADAVMWASRIDADVIRLDQENGGSQEALQAAGLVLGGMLYFMLLIYGQMIVRGVMEEKSSDIVEVLLSSARPWEMMLGKILGVGAVGLTQVAIWAVIIGGAIAYAVLASGPALAEAFAQAGVDVGALARSLLPLFGVFLLFFLLGYVLYSSLFAAAGAMAGSETDAQQVQLPLTLPIIVGFFLMVFMFDAPEALWAVVSAQIPLFSPMVMVARYAGGYAGMAEVALSLVLLALGVVAAVWLAGRVYRVGILMKGKRPNLPELVRWIRYG